MREQIPGVEEQMDNPRPEDRCDLAKTAVLNCRNAALLDEAQPVEGKDAWPLRR